jgi:hypothetical protein
MDYVFILLGVILLLLGRRLFWLLVGVVGFVAGLNLAPLLVTDQPAWAILLIALLAGLVGSVLAAFMQRLMVALAGFLAAGYILTQLLAYFQIDLGGIAWLVFLLGGALGAVLASVTFDWALVILSSLTGATLLVDGLSRLVPGFDGTLSALLILILFIVGIAFQVGYKSRSRAGLA